MILTTTTGHENFPASSAKAHIFFMPTRALPGRQMHLAQFAKAGSAAHGLTAHGQPVRVPAGQGMRMEIVGSWTTQGFNVPDGMVLKVFGQRSTNGVVTSAAVLIRARAGAAFRRLSLGLTGNVKSTLALANFEGRFDVLTPQSAAAAGVVLDDLTVRSLDPAAVRRLFQETVIEPETVSATETRRVAIKNSAGENVVVAEPTRRRIIDL